MAHVLTAAEIAALLDAFADEPGAPAQTPDAQPLDLTSPERVPQPELPGLDLVLGQFARGLRGALATFFGEMPIVTAGRVEHGRFGELTTAIEEPSGLVRFRLTPLRGQGLLVVPAPLVAAMLQVACGGAAGRAVELPAREFSTIELRLIERLAGHMLDELRTAWMPVLPMDCSPVRTEANLRFAAVAARDELAVQSTVTIAVEGFPATVLRVLMPASSLDPVRARLQAVLAADDESARRDEPSWAAAWRAELEDVPLEVTVQLGGAELTVSRFLGLAAGELVPLDVGRDGPVVVRVEGHPRFLGAPGVAGSANAVRITEPA